MPLRLDPFEDRARQPRVQVLDALDLELQIAGVAGLVRGLHVDVDEVVVAQGVQGRLGLALVVRVVKARGAGDADEVHARVDAEAHHQIDGGDDRRLHAEALLQRLHARTPPRRPRPHGVGGVFPAAARAG